ncbi:MAG: helix-turn-helix transcriptional regulator [Mesorhizobium sp.]|nr:MAG: helix-turn-helix transcriptional regulator [Mesorhizobium sp.]
MREVLEFARSRIPAWSRNSSTATFVDTLLRELGKTAPERARPIAIAVKKQMLSSKETDVAALLLRAYTNRQLAESLSMAPDTVKWHLKNIFGKLGVSSRTEAVLKLKEIGLDAATERQLAG